ncbi:GNAT family N-acetyltransferase [Sinomicrobium oceani]|uniref:GNAT family N-acetyltransferase n=1 Tax=Sinomicrobium oceani TaxID=1150368 RepID=UPI00227B3BBE|nr:GNAT family N-acetyltransferase [Sinomicrobium oceani]
MKTKAYIALLLVCIVWGTTYFAIKIGIDHFPPFAFLGIRHTSAGLLLLLGMWFFRRKDISFSRKTVRPQVLPGIFMVGLGNGLLGWVEQYVPTGIIAILFALVPVYVVGYNLFVEKREVFPKAGIAGIVTGFVGVLLIFGDSLPRLADRSYALGLLVAFCCTVFWAAGSMISKKNRSATGPVFNTAIQLLSGGIFLLLLSLATENRMALPPVTPAVAWAMLYLIIFGSLIGFMAYVYAVTYLPLEQVTIHTYINPLVAILLGWAFLGEKISVNSAVAAVLILFGVYLVHAALRRKKFRIVHTKPGDVPEVLELYRAGIALQKLRGEVYWPDFTADDVLGEIRRRGHYKIMSGHRMAAVFSIVYNEPVIWEDTPEDKSVYIHRLTVHPDFRGKGLFGIVKAWMIEEAVRCNVRTIRLDTWSGSERLTAYYRKSGFDLVGTRKIVETKGLQQHYKNIEVALFEIKL